MSKRTKFVIACTVTWLILSCILGIISSKDDWLKNSISESFIYGLGIWFGYTLGMKD